MPNFYEVLGVSRTATPDEIKKAYRSLAARYHPDKHKGNDLEDLAMEKLTALNEAYETLSDTTRRNNYDAALRGQGPVQATGAQGPPPHDLGRSLRMIIRLILIVGIALYSLRIVRSPQAILVVAVVIFILWFGPRILRAFRSRK